MTISIEQLSQNYLAGDWVESPTQIDVLDPANEQVIAQMACANAGQIDQAVAAARRFADSGEFTRERPAQRVQMLYQVAQELRALTDEGVDVLVAENGKTRSEARGEFDTAARYFEYYAGMADKIEGKSIPLGDDYVDFTYYEPVGVSAQIVPWNFPVDICARSVAPALAAGNAVVVKSPEVTPLAINYIAIACERAGVPKGALSILCGLGAEAGAHLVQHKDIDQIVFTGSVATGQWILRAAADNATPCVMELGGKSAAVVFADADLDALITSVDWGIFFNAGQVCSAMSRLIVHEDIVEEVTARVKALAEAQIMGSGREDSTTLTPVASKQQEQAVKQMCEQGLQQGATLVTGGGEVEGAGYFVQPTIFSNVSPQSDLFKKEVFGPVLSISTFSQEEEAWQMANGTDYGLVAGIFTNDLNIAMRGSKKLKAGQVFVNEWYAGGVETPFGGVKMSGFGREKGQEALYSYVTTKNVAIKLS